VSASTKRGVRFAAAVARRVRERLVAAARAPLHSVRGGSGGAYARRSFAVAAVVAVAVFSWWIGGSLTAQPGLDGSWMVGLSLAIARGLVFGRQVVFTYGPLGLAAVPRAVTPGTLVLGLAGAAAIWLALAAVVLHALRRRFPWPIAVLIAIVGLNIVASAPVAPLAEIAFGLVVIALTQPPERARQATRTLALAGGALAGLALLVRVDDGIATTAILTLGLLGGVERRRHLAIGGLTFVLTTVVAWLALGQPLSALGDYLRYSLAIAQGYVDGMGFNQVGVGGQWEVLAVILSALVLSVAAWRSLADRPVRGRAALAGGVLLVHYFVAREMFVRFDAGHATSIALLVALALMIPWRGRQLATGSAITVGLAVAALAVLGAAGGGLGSAVDPFGRESALVSDVGTMLSPQATIVSGEAHIELVDEVPPAIVAALDGHCVDTEPWEVSVVFAYPTWRWCPIGAMQSYTAYTTALDDLDAAGYANARSGPDRVLRLAGAVIDGRNPGWESPAAMLSLLCHFREIARGGPPWQALARIPDRCGRPRLVATIHSGALDVARIPPEPAGSVLVAEVHGLQIYRGERIRTLFARAAERSLLINGSADYRVVPDTLGDGLILDVPAAADYAAPFNLSLGVVTIQAEINQVPVPFSVTLLSVPIKAA